MICGLGIVTCPVIFSELYRRPLGNVPWCILMTSSFTALMPPLIRQTSGMCSVPWRPRDSRLRHPNVHSASLDSNCWDTSYQGMESARIQIRYVPPSLLRNGRILSPAHTGFRRLCRPFNSPLQGAYSVCVECRLSDSV